MTALIGLRFSRFTIFWFEGSIFHSHLLFHVSPAIYDLNKTLARL